MTQKRTLPPLAAQVNLTLSPLCGVRRSCIMIRMDPVTHLSAGAVVYHVVRRRLPAARFLVVFCLFLAILPDADILFFRSDPSFYLRYHRGFSHSILFVLLASPLLGWCYARLTNESSRKKLIALAAGLLSLHIYQDLITSYGTQIFAPFTDARLGMDAVFIIDPLYTGLTLLGLGYLLFRKQHRQIVGLLLLSWILAYPLLCSGLRTVAETQYRQSLMEQNAPYDCLTVTTDALSPLYWKAILVNNGQYALESVRMGERDESTPDFKYRRPSGELLDTLRNAAPFLDTYFWFTAFPFYTETQRPDGGRNLEFGDLRFQSPGPIISSLFSNGRTPFALTVQLNAQGQVQQFVFHRGSKTFAQSLVE